MLILRYTSTAQLFMIPSKFRMKLLPSFRKSAILILALGHSAHALAQRALHRSLDNASEGRRVISQGRQAADYYTTSLPPFLSLCIYTDWSLLGLPDRGFTALFRAAISASTRGERRYYDGFGGIAGESCALRKRLTAGLYNVVGIFFFAHVISTR